VILEQLINNKTSKKCGEYGTKLSITQEYFNVLEKCAPCQISKADVEFNGYSKNLTFKEYLITPTAQFLTKDQDLQTMKDLRTNFVKLINKYRRDKTKYDSEIKLIKLAKSSSNNKKGVRAAAEHVKKFEAALKQMEKLAQTTIPECDSGDMPVDPATMEDLEQLSKRNETIRYFKIKYNEAKELTRTMKLLRNDSRKVKRDIQS